MILMQWGLAQFEVFPLNYHELDHSTATDWARKEIAGAPIHREWVGENDEEVHVRGSIFPFKIGGLRDLEYLDEQRRRGHIHLLARGDGITLGWFAIEKQVRNHKFIAATGIGQRIDFEAAFVRMPIPGGEVYAAQVFSGTPR